jgi:hypothetical protein
VLARAHLGVLELDLLGLGDMELDDGGRADDLISDVGAAGGRRVHGPLSELPHQGREGHAALVARAQLTAPELGHAVLEHVVGEHHDVGAEEVGAVDDAQPRVPLLPLRASQVAEARRGLGGLRALRGAIASLDLVEEGDEEVVEAGVVRAHGEHGLVVAGRDLATEDGDLVARAGPVEDLVGLLDPLVARLVLTPNLVDADRVSHPGDCGAVLIEHLTAEVRENAGVIGAPGHAAENSSELVVVGFGLGLGGGRWGRHGLLRRSCGGGRGLGARRLDGGRLIEGGRLAILRVEWRRRDERGEDEGAWLETYHGVFLGKGSARPW